MPCPETFFPSSISSAVRICQSAARVCLWSAGPDGVVIGFQEAALAASVRRLVRLASLHGGIRCDCHCRSNVSKVASSRSRGPARGNHFAVPGRPAQRHRLRLELRGAMEEFRFLADRRRPGVRWLRTAMGVHRIVPPRSAWTAASHLLCSSAGDLGPGLHQCVGSRRGCLGEHAGGSHPFCDRCRARDHGNGVRLLHRLAREGWNEARAFAPARRPLGPSDRLRQRSGTAAIWARSAAPGRRSAGFSPP